MTLVFFGLHWLIAGVGGAGVGGAIVVHAGVGGTMVVRAGWIILAWVTKNKLR